MTVSFIDPISKVPLLRDPQQDRLVAQGDDGREYRLDDGCYDFAGVVPEVAAIRRAYDAHYSRWPQRALSEDSLSADWHDTVYPWRQTLLRQLGSLAGRRILLLGSGASCRELYFLLGGAELVFTDLSLVATQRARTAFMESELAGKYSQAIQFHAVDATHLPFADGSFDVIYGAKFVPFVPDLARFCGEVHRCLAPGGCCRFTDDAYSPTWDFWRRKVFLRLRSLLQKNHQASVELVRQSTSFGFRLDELEPLANRYRFKSLVFEREYFFLRATALLWGSFVKFDRTLLRLARPLYVLAKWVDLCLSRTRWMQRNSLALTWGFDK